MIGTRTTGNEDPGEPARRPDVPSLQLPKGGGAIRGIGETVTTNPATGTASVRVPIAVSPGRSGFGPSLTLTYDSARGNGVFGFGWELSLPSISRRTDGGVPRYDGSDVFVLSDRDDLVPVLTDPDDRTVPGYVIERYRPRVEGLFARIERWTRTRDGDVHWRSISPDNVLTVFGADPNLHRVTAPDDPRKVFAWLVSETRDDRGNAIIYDYREDDGTGVVLSRVSERNRGGRQDRRRRVQRYP